MRRILIEQARRRGRLKRGGEEAPTRRAAIELDALAADAPDEEIVALDEASEHWRPTTRGRLVELRFFGSMTLAQAAECLAISPSSADRAWRYARTLLYVVMADAQEERDAADVFRAPTTP